MDALATYLATGRAMSPWIDHAIAAAWWVAPGITFVAIILATSRATSAVARAIRKRREDRAWHIDDLEDFANNPDNPRYTRTPARKEKP